MLLACALVGHLWMQTAGAHAGADPASHAVVHGHEAAEIGAGSGNGHEIAAGCVAVLAVAALMSPRLRAVVRRHPAPGAAVRVLGTARSPQPLRPPRPARAPVEQGVLLRV